MSRCRLGWLLGVVGLAGLPLAHAAPVADPLAAISAVAAPREGNTILANPFPDDPELAPTLVSVDLKGAGIEEALDELTADANYTFDVPTPPQFSRTPQPTVDLHLSKQPFLEGLLQLQSRTGLAVTFPRPRHLDARLANPSPFMRQGVSPGVWSISGPFALILTDIHHSLSLGRDGKPTGSGDYWPAETCSMNFRSLAEPKLRVLQYPNALKIQEVVDEHDHSLVPTGALPAYARFSRPMGEMPQFSVPLGYPADNPGRTIVRLKGTAQFLVQTAGKTLTIADPMDAEKSEQDVGGLHVSLGKVTWEPRQRNFLLPVTYKRDPAKLDDAAWKSMALALPAARPAFVGDGKKPFFDMTPGMLPGRPPAGDQISVTYRAWPGGMPNEPEPILQKVTLDVPVTVREVTVPFEFKDLPLP